jgi:hypothetical protein
LSNCAQLTLYEDIYDSSTDVTGITYTVNLPAGVTVKSISYAGAISSSLQKVTTTATNTIDNYDAYTW